MHYFSDTLLQCTVIQMRFNLQIPVDCSSSQADTIIALMYSDACIAVLIAFILIA